MEKRVSVFSRRILALLLCVAMLPPAVAVPGGAEQLMTAVEDFMSPDATLQADTGISLPSCGASKKVTAVDTKTNQFCFKPFSGAPKVGGRYLIQSVKYPQHVMSYSAVATVPGKMNPAKSLTQVSGDLNPIPTDNTNVFFQSDAGNIYLDHSNRDSVT